MMNKKYMPCDDFWRNYIKKAFSFSVSFKVHIVIIATFLLLFNKISDTVWSSTIVAIALGRVVIEGIYLNNQHKNKEKHHE